LPQLQHHLAALPKSTGENVWPNLRRQLELAALIELEKVPGISSPFLQFHPTLAPLLWSDLDADEQSRLADVHRARYFQLSKYLYSKDNKKPHEVRAIAWRELPNLLHAVQTVMDMDAADSFAVDFAENVTKFLINFGLRREAETLTDRAEAIARDVGSQAWVLAQSNRGDQLLESGHVAAAANVFTLILDTLGDHPSFNRAVALSNLGRCHRDGGRPDLAEASHREGILVTEQLDPSDSVKRHRGVLHKELADVLRDQGRFVEAHEHYEVGLTVTKEVDDLGTQALILGQLGTMALLEQNLTEAETRYSDAFALFRSLHDPTMEAVATHQLGRVFEEARNWEKAERHYREAARLEEANGNLSGAAQAWTGLATVSRHVGRLGAAETWYRKAIETGRALKGSVELVARNLNNLADLLQTQPHRLCEARELAEEALGIRHTLDPGAVEIWKTYHVLAEIADQQSRRSEAAEYRRLAREAKRNFPGTRHELRRFAELITATVAACSGDEEAAALVATYQEQMRQTDTDWTRCAEALDRLLSGDRDALCAGMFSIGDCAMIIEAIRAGLSDPSSLSDLLPTDD